MAEHTGGLYVCRIRGYTRRVTEHHQQPLKGRLRAAFAIPEMQMAASTDDEALRCLLAHEGGYSNRSSDPSGLINFGITTADYRKYVSPRAHPTSS
jgi:hypothetical protein